MGIADYQTNPSQRHKAIMELIIAATLWSLGGLLIKWVDWHPVAIAGMRSLIAAGVLVAFCRPLRFNGSFYQIGGAVLYALMVVLFVTATKLTTAANAILLQYTAPIYVALFGSWFLGEKTKLYDWCTIGFAAGGMFLFFQGNLSTGGFWGNIAAILSGVAYAGFVLFTRKQKDGSSLESILLGNIFTAIAGLPFMFGSYPTVQGWIGLGLLGVFQLGFSYIFFSRALKHLTALDGILIPIIEPVLNPVWVFLFMGERPSGWAIAGGLVIVGAVTSRCIFETLKE